MVTDPKPMTCSKCKQVIQIGERYRVGLFNPDAREHIDCSEGVLPEDDDDTNS
jgi:hypothetical protein